MRKNYVFCFILAIAFVLSACGPSAEEQAEIDQYNEWKAQAEEIAPLLEDSLYNVYDVDLSVYQTSGVISASVEAVSDYVNRSGFGAVCSLMGGRFLSLTEEYSDYSFGHITFFYYHTTKGGRKRDDAAITYTLNSDGSSSFLEPQGDILARYDITPDEVYYYLSGVSPDISEVSPDARSIPNLTFMQEALVPDNSFSPAPVEIFSTTAEENGLGDRAFYASGEIVSRSDIGGYDTILIATEAGDLYISATLVDLPEISDGEAVTVYFVYTGWSDSLSGACGAYVYSE